MNTKKEDMVKNTVIVNEVCGFNYYWNTEGHWEGLINNATPLTEFHAQSALYQLERQFKRSILSLTKI